MRLGQSEINGLAKKVGMKRKIWSLLSTSFYNFYQSQSGIPFHMLAGKLSAMLGPEARADSYLPESISAPVNRGSLLALVRLVITTSTSQR